MAGAINASAQAVRHWTHILAVLLLSGWTATALAAPVHSNARAKTAPPGSGATPPASHLQQVGAQRGIILPGGISHLRARGTTSINRAASRQRAPRRAAGAGHLLTDLGAALMPARVRRRSPVHRRMVRRPGSRGHSNQVERLAPQALQLLSRARRAAPGLAPHAKSSAAGRVAWVDAGVPVMRAGPDAYVAPNAAERLARRLDLLHAEGLSHNAVHIRNIRVDRYGELRLVGWKRCRDNADPQTDHAGLEQVRAYLRRHLGVGG